MTQPKRDTIGIVSRWGGVVLLICLFFPPVHKSIAAFGFIAMSLAVLVVVALVGFGAYRLATRDGEPTTGNPFAAPSKGSGQTWPTEVRTDGLDGRLPSLRRRYPWRHEKLDC